MSLCEKPYITREGAYRCGRCLFCRIHKKREWTHRLLLEALGHEHNAFVTLTFDDDRLPGDLSVSPRTLSLFVKRLRDRLNRRIRFYGIGEYGSDTLRPHYHLALFNYPSCLRGLTYGDGTSCCDNCDVISSTWRNGRIQVAELSSETAGYIAGYVTKKLSQSGLALNDRAPEFARMSNRPGIGAHMVPDIASCLLEHSLEKTLVDVPVALSHGTRKLPLGRYLRRKLREQIGRHPNAPQLASEDQKEKLQEMRILAWETQTPLSQIVSESTLGKRINTEARNKIRKRNGV